MPNKERRGALKCGQMEAGGVGGIKRKIKGKLWDTDGRSER